MAEKKSYQSLKTQLDQVLVELQHEDTSIDQAVQLHQKAEKLLKELDAYLEGVAKDANLEVKSLRTG